MAGLKDIVPFTTSRKVGQAIQLGKNVRIVVQQISGESVHLLVEAPLEMDVFCEENLTSLDDHKANQSPEDDQALLMKMEDGQ